MHGEVRQEAAFCFAKWGCCLLRLGLSKMVWINYRMFVWVFKSLFCEDQKGIVLGCFGLGWQKYDKTSPGK